MSFTRFMCLSLLIVLGASVRLHPQTLSFAGTKWNIKASRIEVGPGPNVFSRAAVKKSGDAVTLTIMPKTKNDAAIWYSAEMYSAGYFGYGTFELKFTLTDPLDRNAVFGFFLYDSDNPPGYSEADVELARWGIVDAPDAQFTVHPVRSPDDYFMFSLNEYSGQLTARIVWSRERVSMMISAADGSEIARWTYAGHGLPFSKAETERVRLHCNLWLFEGAEPAGDGILSVRLDDFSFTEE